MFKKILLMSCRPLVAQVACFAALACVLTATASRAAINVTGGTLRAQVSAYYEPTRTSQDTLDQPLNLPSTTLFADKQAVGQFGTAFAHADATVGVNEAGSIFIDAHTNKSGGGLFFDHSATAGITGTIFFTETEAGTVGLVYTDATDFGVGSVQIRDALNNQVFAVGSPSKYATSKAFALSAGLYSITWSFAGQYVTGQGGPAAMELIVSQIPEPTNLPFVLACCWIGCRRKGLFLEHRSNLS
ncbi:MAG TPA: hypothetical protein VF669_07465 [Tepidisphaeraceae bacterium]